MRGGKGGEDKSFEAAHPPRAAKPQRQDGAGTAILQSGSLQLRAKDGDSS